MKILLGRKIIYLLFFGILFSLVGFSPISFSSTDNIFINPEIAQAGIFVGDQVVEVKIVDPDISNTNEAKAEPDVKVNGKELRMVQSSDGNWYGYFADRHHAQIADQSVVDEGTPGQGRDFGTFCSTSTNIAADNSVLISTDDTSGITLSNVGSGGSQGLEMPHPQPFSECTDIGEGFDNMNVISTARVMNPGDATSVLPGQINLNPDAWPFIQLYLIVPNSNVLIQYTKDDIVQTITIVLFDQTPTAEERTKDLRFIVKFKNLPSKVEKKLLQPLDKILKNLNDDNPNNDKNICKSLDVFINKVKSQSGKQIPKNDAQSLNEFAKQVKFFICN